MAKVCKGSGGRIWIKVGLSTEIMTGPESKELANSILDLLQDEKRRKTDEQMKKINLADEINQAWIKYFDQVNEK